AAARRRGATLRVTRAGQVYRLGALTLRVLWPPSAGGATDDPNDWATVLLASYGEVDILLPADAESNVTLLLRPPAVEVLKVGHHGSKDEGLGDLLELVRPRVAVISVGRRNDYGHPAPSTLAALEAASQLAVYRTDEHGSVVLETDGHAIAVRTDR
ncbi:MAG: MBL fold metallo-hydrolase, partial [Actinomycetota bacterium]|nr:MBL fold metallo-hydrolase [Actinomycetota bacterium]